MRCKVRYPGLFMQFWKEGSLKIEMKDNRMAVGKTGKMIKLNFSVKESYTKGMLILETEL